MTAFDLSDPAFQGFNEPSRLEADVFDLEIHGALPRELSGAWYRLGPDPQFVPHRRHLFFGGDGMVSMFLFDEGSVRYRSRYVRTERLMLERAAGRALFGEYRNPFTDEPAVRGRSRATVNTTVIEHAGLLWALKEDSPPVQLEPITLETIGMSTFGGCMTSTTMTAHPKADRMTGELIFYGSAAKGETTPDIAVYTADAAGRITKETWIVPPYASMVHDFAVTENWIVFPIMPTVSSLERLEDGQIIYNWEPELGMYVGVLPRHGGAHELRWFRGESCWVYHVMNAFEDGDEIHVDLCDGPIQPFPFFHVDPSKTWNPNDAVTRLTRWTIKPRGNTDSFTKRVLGPWWVDLPKIDERMALGRYAHGFTATNDFEKPMWNTPGESGFVYNSIAHWNHNGGDVRLYYLGDHCSTQEPQFVPRAVDAPEGDGWLLAIRQCYEDMSSQLLVLDTRDIEAGPIATVRLPFRLRNAIHGCWVGRER